MAPDFEPEIVDFPYVASPRVDDKAIQLYVSDVPGREPDVPVLIFGQGIHGIILQRYLRSRGLEYETLTGAFSRQMLPKPEGLQYRVVGMAGVSVMPEDHLVLVCDIGSLDYPRYRLNASHLEKILGYCRVPEPWEILT